MSEFGRFPPVRFPTRERREVVNCRSKSGREPPHGSDKQSYGHG